LLVAVGGVEYDLLRRTGELREQVGKDLPEEPDGSKDPHRFGVSRMTSSQRKVLRYAVGVCHKGVLGDGGTPPGVTHLAKLRVDTGDHPPVQKKAYKSPYAERVRWEKFTGKLLKYSTTRPSRSP